MTTAPMIAWCLGLAKVARVYQHEHGPQTGEWAWFGQWGGYDNSGVVATLDAALNAVRDGFERIATNA